MGVSVGHYSIARLPRRWYVACRSDELASAAPLPRVILDTPLVLFRDADGTARALLDRCAHRNVPLSRGYCEGGQLVCGYHGWCYGGDGVVTKVPALVGAQTGKARRVPSHPVVERQGYVWAWMDAEVPPEGEPYLLPCLDTPGYDTIRYEADVPATLHATSENILDVPHTAFLHKGLFRGSGEPNPITAIVRRGPDRVEAEYVGEPRPSGWIARFLAPSGGTVEHFDRFVMPSVAEVEYRLGPENHLVVTSLLTPISDFVTRMYSAASFKLRVPHALVQAALKPLAQRVLAQDIVILAAQTEAVKRFDGEQYASTDVDLLGPHIWRLLKQAERGEVVEPVEERVELLA